MSVKLLKVLKSKGYDTMHVIEVLPSLEDTEVLELAIKQKAILMTFDLDFGRLVFLKKLPVQGVVLIRLTKASETEIHQQILALLENYVEKIPGNFVVMDPMGIRFRPLPQIA